MIGCFTFECGPKITWILVNLHGAFLLTKKLESREKGIKYFYYRVLHPPPIMLSLDRNSGEANGINTGSLLLDIWWLLKEPFLLVESN